MNLQLWLIRHGETEWSLSGQHTSKTDIPLTARGEERATKIRDYLAHRSFNLVLVSPMVRAGETCRIAGYGDVAQVDDNLKEWDYGIYEGKTTADIRKGQPDWLIWNAAPPEGEPAGRRPLEFPEDELPDFWDFMYFSFVIGMCAQVSDVTVSSKSIRRTVLAHGIISFLFNAALLALTVNIAASAI